MRVEGQIWMLQEMELLWESGTQTVEEHDEKIKGRGGDSEEVRRDRDGGENRLKNRSFQMKLTPANLAYLMYLLSLGHFLTQ